MSEKKTDNTNKLLQGRQTTATNANPTSTAATSASTSTSSSKSTHAELEAAMFSTPTPMVPRQSSIDKTMRGLSLTGRLSAEVEVLRRQLTQKDQKIHQQRRQLLTLYEQLHGGAKAIMLNSLDALASSPGDGTYGPEVTDETRAFLNEMRSRLPPDSMPMPQQLKPINIKIDPMPQIPPIQLKKSHEQLESEVDKLISQLAKVAGEKDNEAREHVNQTSELEKQIKQATAELQRKDSIIQRLKSENVQLKQEFEMRQKSVHEEASKSKEELERVKTLNARNQAKWQREFDQLNQKLEPLMIKAEEVDSAKDAAKKAHAEVDSLNQELDRVTHEKDKELKQVETLLEEARQEIVALKESGMGAGRHQPHSKTHADRQACVEQLVNEALKLPTRAPVDSTEGVDSDRDGHTRSSSQISTGSSMETDATNQQSN